MNDRDCKNCIRSKGVTEYDNGCTAWECEYINRREAIAVWKEFIEEYREKYKGE